MRGANEHHYGAKGGPSSTRQAATWLSLVNGCGQNSSSLGGRETSIQLILTRYFTCRQGAARLMGIEGNVTQTCHNFSFKINKRLI